MTIVSIDNGRRLPTKDRFVGTALITGASRGIGAVYADRLAKLEALAARLTGETGRSVTALRADLDDKADVAKVLNADFEKIDDMIALSPTLRATPLSRLSAKRVSRS
jgi:short-subunit dehydrogenase